MTLIEFVIAIVVLAAVLGVLNSIAAIPAATKRILNIVVTSVIVLVAVIFLLTFFGLAHRRI